MLHDFAKGFHHIFQNACTIWNEEEQNSHSVQMIYSPLFIIRLNDKNTIPDQIITKCIENASDMCIGYILRNAFLNLANADNLDTISVASHIEDILAL